MQVSRLKVRLYTKLDPISEITNLLHASYAEWKDAGLHFTACDQDEAKTLHRLTEGTAWLAEIDGRLIGTIALNQGRKGHEVPYYRRNGLFFFSQFGIHPDFKGKGFGKLLYEVA
jgi:GNAT superfamily N-acetyltransferase